MAGPPRRGGRGGRSLKVTAAQRPIALIGLAIWAGLVTGFGEVAAMGVHLLFPGFIPASRDAVWMIPAFDAALFAGFGLALALVSLPVRVSWRAAMAFLIAVGAWLVLLLFPTLYRLASLVLAAGLGVQVYRRLAGQEAASRQVVWWSLPRLALTVCLLAGVTVGWRILRERQLTGSRAVAAAGAPNVLLLILDTVRAADLSLYGYARPTSPELERFAESGTVFDEAFAPASWTTPSHASIFTGRWPHQLDVSWRRGLGARWPTLTEALRARGYATAAFVANTVYAGWQSGLARGFERFHDYPVSLWTAVEVTSFGRNWYPRLRAIAGRHFRHLPLLWRLPLPPLPRTRESAEEIGRTFLSWLDHRTDRAPFFAFLNFMDAHMPYVPPDSFRSRFVSPPPRPLSPEAWSEAPTQRLTPADARPRHEVYDGCIAYLDSQLGRLLRELGRRGLLENTLVVITADHGDEFAEHGLVNHGYSIYRPSLHVPLVLSFPGRVPAGRRVTAPVSLRNLAATILVLTDPHTRSRLPGRSLARLWHGADTAADTIVASIRRLPNQPDWYPSSQGDINSIAFDGWRYIRQEGSGAEELYDFSHDLLERWNRAGSPDGARILPRYRAALDSLLARAAQGGTPLASAAD